MDFYNLSKKLQRKKKCSPSKIQLEIRQFFYKIGDFLPKTGYIWQKFFKKIFLKKRVQTKSNFWKWKTRTVFIFKGTILGASWENAY
jgi:hypothetical protein